jgi:adenylate cyclase, class 2
VIEAELKARLAQPHMVRARLEALARGTRATYWDAYFDTPDHALDSRDMEIRLRSVDDDEGQRDLLTFKAPAVDEASRSKPEYESQVIDPDAITVMLQALGMDIEVEFTKECTNYDLTSDGRRFLATLVRVPELDGEFLEVETQTTEEDLPAALAAVRGLMAVLGVSEDELTTDTYTDAVTAARARERQ